MSGSVKDEAPGEREAEAAALPRVPAVPAVPAAKPRTASQNLFELDSPRASGAHALGLPPLGVKLESPANDVPPAPPLRAPTPSNGTPQLSGDPLSESALIDAEFEALTSTLEFDVPKLAPEPAGVLRGDTRALTHVPAEQNFDATLRLPRASDAIEVRRGRLAIRYKSACATYKVLAGLSLSSSDRKEVVDLFSAYESGLRAASPPPGPAEAKRDADELHNSLPPAGLDEHERTLNKIEERLLALDECVSDSEFRSNVSKSKHPIKILLRYARVLASRRFNIGFRRDRFEYLAVELLTNPGPDKRLQLLPRDQAQPVLQHLLAGLPQVAAAEERGPATAHLCEALDRLGEIGSAKEFFESEFFLDLHGYKISMRDQVTCPEFLYLCAALQVEVHNRMLAWASSGNPSWQSLRQQLHAQQSAAEEVFANFRKPRSTPAAKSSPRPLPAKEASPQPVPPKRKKRRTAETKAEEAATANRIVWAKLAALALVIASSGGWLLYQTGAVQVGTPPVVLDETQLSQFSPLLIRGVITPRQQRLDGTVRRNQWQRLTKQERRAAAADLVTTLKQKNLANARILAYKTPVIVIEFSTVVSVDETGAKP